MFGLKKPDRFFLRRRWFGNRAAKTWGEKTVWF